MRIKKLLYFSLLSVVLLTGIVYHFNLHYLLIFLPVLIFILLLGYGIINIRSDLFLTSLSSARITEKKIAITFDDGPHQLYTGEVLNMLQEFKVAATFFLIGKNVSGNEAILKRIIAEGHLVANHTFGHSFLIDFKNAENFEKEILQAEEAIFNITGLRTALFRPPYGVTTPHIARAVRKLKYHSIGWNIRSYDTTSVSIPSIVKRVTRSIKPGSIILFHDTSPKSAKVLKETIVYAENNGFKIVSVAELLNISPYKT